MPSLFPPPSSASRRPAKLIFSLLGSLGLAATPAVQAAGDAAHGKALFQQSCALCHATGQESQPIAVPGPLLAGVVGRSAASMPKYLYTPALQTSKLTWDTATLNRFLESPPTVVPGTAMAIMIANPTDRDDVIAFLATLTGVSDAAAAAYAPPPVSANTIAADNGSYRKDAPGVVHHVQVDKLPAPFTSISTRNTVEIVTQPATGKLTVPAGFKIELFASGLNAPRLVRTAPNGDLFIAETRAGKIRVLRAADGATKPSHNEIFAEGLRGPFGIAFYPLGANPQWVYVANLNSVVRYPYQAGDLKARGAAEVVVPTLAETTGGHSTRDIVFSLDGKRMFIAVGSGSNVAEGMPIKTPAEIRTWEAEHGVGASWVAEANRAAILYTDPEGKSPLRTFATGIRNPVGLAVNPANGEVWTSTNERDGLGDDLVPDYITRVREGGYYGWPWYYMGKYEEPRHKGERPDLAGRAIVPDVPLQAHSAPLGITFYTASSGASAFPAEFRGSVFGASHGSWNRSVRTGTKIVRIRMKDGAPTGEYEDFVTGFVIDNTHAWGRPVGVTVARDGALLITEDVNGTMWRVTYTGDKTAGKGAD